MAEKRSSQKSEIAELYGLPFEQFTAARNALAARLRGAGRKADAEAVKALAKPSLSAWAVNQLFRRDEGKMEALLEAGRRARSAQRDAVAGRGAEAFRETLTAARRLLEELRREAAALLAEGGKTPGAGIVERVATDLEALAFSPAAATVAKRGYLDADLDPPGFEVLAGLQLAAAKAPAKPPAQPPPKSPPKAAAKSSPGEPPGATPRLLRFKPPRKETAEAARRARVEAKRQERVARAEAVVEKAAEKAKAGRAEATAAEREAATARRQADALERAAAEAGRRAEAAEAELSRAREDLAAARES